MASGTPRQALLQDKQSKELLKSWTSFDESPIHAGDGGRSEEGWMSFKESQTSVSQSDFNTSLPYSSPAPSYIAKSRLPVISQHQTIASTGQISEASIVNRTGIGTDKQTPNVLPRSQSHMQHSQPDAATHGPGSTITHLLRHKSNDADTEPAVDSSLQKPGEKSADSLDTRTSNVGAKENQKHSDSSHYHYSATGGGSNLPPDPWFVTDEQGKYYRNQFSSMQQNLEGKIDGQTARSFFTKSRLPIPELSHIWELCDMDQDGHLTLLEFCAAFHLVVARKNGYDLPPVLPKTLLPPLMKMFGQPSQTFSTEKLPTVDTQITKGSEDELSQSIVITSPAKSKSNSSASKESSEMVLPKKNEGSLWVSQQEKWETFSDRTSSSTNLANFEQNLGQTENLPHPVPLRITPSRHEMHSSKMRKDKDMPKSTDDEEHHQHQYTVPPSHKSLTNPYGSLKNDFSEPDSHASPRVRSSSNSSHSSAGTSDRSISEIDAALKQIPRASDQEYQSDWSSRPLQPRSGSDSSIASSLDAIDGGPTVIQGVPTPPPRPLQQAKSSKSDSLESDSHISEDSKIPSLSAPTPPPRPQQAAKKNPVNQIEEFADFSRFENTTVADEGSKSQATTTDSSEDVIKSRSDEEQSDKPTPAPRHNREEKIAKTKEEVKEESSPDRSLHRKAPTKPPRSRIRSVETATDDVTPKIIKPNSLVPQTDDLPAIAEKPNQDKGRCKTDIQQAIRNLKCRNTKLTKLNADLQQELKNVMQSRITVEMSIHQLRPFSQ